MSIVKRIIDSKKFIFSETSFKKLMQNRIYKVLVICSNYDYYMLEDDGRIDEQIFHEYVSLNLRYPPEFLHAENYEKAKNMLTNLSIDLVITMFSIGSSDIFYKSKEIKKEFPDIPIVLLTQFSREVNQRIEDEDLSAIDYVFAWLGNVNILLAIIKLIEDKMNAEYDVNKIGVQTIILVENSIKFYSSYLPNMYKIIFKQANEFRKEGLNQYREMLRLRGRPKILMATNFERAIYLFNKYKNNCLGVITDVEYKKNGVSYPNAGIELSQIVKQTDKHIPILLQSSNLKNRAIADKLGVGFIHKNSKSINIELRKYIFTNLAFGDFIFKMPDGTKIARSENLRSLQKQISTIDVKSLEYHFNKNDFSRWLNARALYPLAKKLTELKLNDFKSVEKSREYILGIISSFRIKKSRGVIAKFDKNSFDEYTRFSRIGEGSLGGKARGLAFSDLFIKNNDLSFKYDNIIIKIPRTVVLSIDVFDEFMENNDLYEIALSDSSDKEILDKFIEAKLPNELIQDLKAFISIAKNPIAIRSSSAMEDSHYQPFAGIYSTCMIPMLPDNKETTKLLSIAIKSVYASVYFNDSKSYMTATSNLIDEERMGIVLQEVCGQTYSNRFYPILSGIARSVNFYPIPPEQTEDGIAKIAFGLGKYIVEGGVSLRFSPKYPKKILQLTDAKTALRETQKKFYALDLNPDSFKISTDDSVNILSLRIKDAMKDKSLKDVGSIYDFQNDILRDGVNYKGKPVITFANILKYNMIPIANIIQDILKIGQKEMNTPVEIEYAMDLTKEKDEPHVFYLLQIRPIVDNSEEVDENLNKIQQDKLIIKSKSALGNGVVEDIFDFIYVKPDSFNAANNPYIANRIAEINAKFVDENKNYILVGPGRWGSSDHWLGIPVKWTNISAARLIVESGLDKYRIDPSQGTHFFQNLTSFRVGYFTINPYMNDGFYDVDFLSNSKVYYEDEYIRHIRFEKPAIIKIDGKKNIGVVLKP